MRRYFTTRSAAEKPRSEGGGNMKRAFVGAATLWTLLTVASGSAAETGQEATRTMKPALLVIDTQNEYLPMMSDRDRKFAPDTINAVIALFRKHGLPVIRVYNTDPKWGPKPDTQPFEFPESIAVEPDDPKIIKYYGNAFNKTDLDKILREKGRNTVFLSGLDAAYCVLATYVGAEDLDYDAFMVRDAVMSHDAAVTTMVEDAYESVTYKTLRILLENAQK
jgi:nicotinamidase-related amidase